MGQVSEYPSSVYLSRYCLPSNSSTVVQLILNNYIAQGSPVSNYFSDISTAWWTFLVVALLAMVFSFLYLVLLRCCTKPLVWITIILIFVLFLAGGAYVYERKNMYPNNVSTQRLMIGCGIVRWVLAAIYFVIICCCCKRIRLGIGIFETTANFVR